MFAKTNPFLVLKADILAGGDTTPRQRLQQEHSSWCPEEDAAGDVLGRDPGGGVDLRLSGKDRENLAQEVSFRPPW